MKQRDPRILYLSLLAVAILGGAVGFAIERFAPTHELAPKHSAATTPIALALTSPTVEMLLAVAACIAYAGGLTLGAFWYFWRRPGKGLLIGRTDPIVWTVLPTTVMIFTGLNCVADLPRMGDAGWFSWTLYSLLAILGALGVLTFALQVVNAMHPLLRVKR